MRPLHVLYVDDNPADVMLATEAFERHAATVTLTTRSGGRTALAYLHAAQPRPDVVVLDINMPEMSGFDVLRRMKEDDLLLSIPVVMLSTSSSPEHVQRAYTLHASSYLVKRQDFRAFVEQVDSFVAYLHAMRLPDWSDAGKV